MFSPYPSHVANFPSPSSFAQPYAPMVRQLPQQTIGMGGRGLLGRLFQGIGGANKLGGIAASQMQPVNLLSMIENTQKVINIVQSVTPMVQQYGPILRNLPTLYKMLKESPSVETNTTTDDSNITTQNGNVTNIEKKETSTTTKKSPTLVKKASIETRTSPKMISNIPAPKIYV